MIDFTNCFTKLTGNPPFHWQEELFKRFIGGAIPSECDVPTGLGKTSTIAIWLLALAQSLMAQQATRKIPRRLVYVVDRRVIVDQSFVTVERVVDRTAYYTWLALKSKEGETGKVNASPLALRGLLHDQKAWPTPPVRPHLDSARLDDWSMTSLRQVEFPRPLVAYWMRGVTVDETVQTTFCWRADLNYAGSDEEARDMARAMPVARSERAR